MAETSVGAAAAAAPGPEGDWWLTWRLEAAGLLDTGEPAVRVAVPGESTAARGVRSGHLWRALKIEAQLDVRACHTHSTPA